MKSRDALLIARSALREAMSLHIASVAIGRLESVLDTGVAEQDLERARRILERMFQAEAEVTKHLGQTSAS